MVRKIGYGLTAVLTVAGILSEYLLHVPVLVVFSLTTLAMIGLAWLLSESTESLGHHAGPRIGGILNATLGNAAELIVSIFALSAGLTTVVKATIIGSVLSNVLLVTSMGILIGGLKNGDQSFSGTVARANATMLVIATIGLSLPTIFAAQQGGTQATEYVSIGVAVVLFVAYALLLLFYFTHPAATSAGDQQEGGTSYSLRASLALLLVSGGAVGWVSEIFVGTIEQVVSQIGVSELFLGLILVPLLGNAAEHATAVVIAYRNMDFSMFISIGSSLQIALLVAPVLVFLGPLLGHPLRLTFSALELASLAGAAIVATVIALDGESNWMEGVMLCGVYLVAAFTFVFA